MGDENKVPQVATDTSAPFDQRFAFKFKCFLLTNAKSSTRLPAYLSFSFARLNSLPHSHSIAGMCVCVCGGVCESDRLVILLFKSLDF